MSQIPMSEADWDAALVEWNESLEWLTMPDALVLDLVSMSEVEGPESFTKPKKKGSGRYIEYKAIGMTRPKAKFFITESGTPVRGFWCPRGAILEDIGDKVFVATWCTIKTITFN